MTRIPRAWVAPWVGPWVGHPLRPAPAALPPCRLLTTVPVRPYRYAGMGIEALVAELEKRDKAAAAAAKPSTGAKARRKALKEREAAEKAKAAEAAVSNETLLQKDFNKSIILYAN